MSALDLALLELEKRLYRYAKVGPELLEMADEGLVLAARTKGARLSQSLSAAQHTEGHPQVVGCGRVAAHQHAPFVERRASPYGGGLVAAVLAGTHDVQVCPGATEAVYTLESTEGRATDQ